MIGLSVGNLLFLRQGFNKSTLWLHTVFHDIGITSIFLSMTSYVDSDGSASTEL